MDYQIIMNCLEEALNITVKEYSKEIESAVKSTIYRRPKTLYYERTGNFLAAIQGAYVEDNEVHLFDSSELESMYGEIGKFGHHKSFPWNKPSVPDNVVKENLYDWLNEGFTILGTQEYEGFGFDDGANFEPGSPFYEKFLKNAINIIKKTL